MFYGPGLVLITHTFAAGGYSFLRDPSKLGRSVPIASGGPGALSSLKSKKYSGI